MASDPEAMVEPEDHTPHELNVLATVAHELRGPLTALATSSELLAEDFLQLDPEQVKHMLGAMHRRTLWLQGLVENLLAAATIREGRLHLYRQSLSLADLFDDVEAVVGPLLAQRRQRLRVRMAEALPEVLADSRRLGQVLINLILNASKFAEEHKPIDVTVSVPEVRPTSPFSAFVAVGRTSSSSLLLGPESAHRFAAEALGGAVRVAVSDRGPGVSSEQAHLLFEPYYRAPASAGSGKDGIGLGLSIVKSIVEAHGGLVGVENRRGGGARFWFAIPTAKSHLSIVS